MSTVKKTIIKEGIQNFKYELAFIKHKLDLVENLISGLEEKIYSDEPSTDHEDHLLSTRVKVLMEEYQKLQRMVNPEKVKFESEETFEELV
ncbi:MAG TPA: hypothetical protein VD908_19895 [Cytophagales bacterium]|nr:hypothetical protein [Cytophagales bacterium]